MENPIEKEAKDMNRQSIEAETQMNKTFIKSYSVSLIIGEIQIKTRKLYFMSIILGRKIKFANTKYWQECGGMGPYIIYTDFPSCSE